ELMVHADEGLRLALGGPPKVLEEGDVRELDVGDHAPASPAARRRPRKAHQGRTEMVRAPLSGNRQPVAFPERRRLIERIDPHRAGYLVTDQPDDVNGARVLVVRITVVWTEQPLLTHEHPASQPEMRGEVRRVRRGTAFERVALGRRD